MNASSEPTPLSAHFQPLTLEEERRYFRWCDEQRDYIGRVTAWRKFDAQATEIAALKDALEETREQLQHDFAIRCRCDFVTKLPAGIERCVGCRARDRIEAISRVLAGKEAQCPKCEGRGFIRTMVDGERDSEPCSFCRMSGLAGKGAQGD